MTIDLDASFAVSDVQRLNDSDEPTRSKRDLCAARIYDAAMERIRQQGCSVQHTNFGAGGGVEARLDWNGKEVHAHAKGYADYSDDRGNKIRAEVEINDDGSGSAKLEYEHHDEGGTAASNRDHN